MKKIKLFLAAAALMIGGGNLLAQTWTASEVGAGSFYLYNVGSGMYLTGGNSWGTHSSIDNAGIEVTLASSGTGYTINTKPAYNQWLNLNNSTEPFVDAGSSAVWSFIPVAGQENTYFMKLGDNYLAYDGSNTSLIFPAEEPTTSNGYWKLVTKANRIADFANATKANPVDATFLLADHNFGRNNQGVWEGSPTKGGKNENFCAEKFMGGANETFNVYQTVDVPNGKYQMNLQGFDRWNDGSTYDAKPAETARNAGTEVIKSYYYIKNVKHDFMSILDELTGNGDGSWTEVEGGKVPQNMEAASVAFTAGLYENEAIAASITDGSLTVGMKNDGSVAREWTIFDNVRVYYLGPNLAAVDELPVGAMTADKWYYFDIALDGNYNLTCTTPSDIVYTTDGSILVEDASSITANFGANPVELTAGRYYVKSSSVQELTIAALTYSYNVGSATTSIVEGSYLKALTTVTFAFSGAASNDPGATFALLNGSAVATLKQSGVAVKNGTLSLTGTTLTATFSDVDLDYASTYSVELPADVVGYAGEATNTAVSVNFNTPVFADGDYYLKNKDNGAYFAAGNSWGTHAITNNIGHIVTLTALSDGKYTINSHIYNNASSHFLNDVWSDGASTGWSFVSSETYYQINNGSGNLTAAAVGADLTIAAGDGDATKWSLLTPAQWKSEQESRLDAAAADNGVDATFYLPGANFNRNDNDENAKWQGSPAVGGQAENCNGEKFNTTPFDVYQELTGLQPGLYKVAMQGFYRNGTTDDRKVKLYANGYSVDVANIRSTEITAKDDAKGFTTANGDYFVPNSQEEAAKAFNNNYYNHELMFVVDEDGALRIGVKKETGADNDWALFDNFQLTYYGAAPEAKMTIAAANKWATFVAPFDVKIPSGVNAYKILTKSDNTLNLTAVETTIPANTPVVVYSESAVNETFKGVAVDGTPEVGMLTGVYEDTDAPVGSYVLQNHEGAVGFYQVEAGTIPNVPANRAYLTVGGGVKAYFFGGETVIKNVFDGVAAGEIYDLNGTKVAKMQPGKAYIVNGTSVIVK